MTPRELVLFLRWRYDPRYSDASDGALLEQYVSSRDEIALRALVSRHAGPLLNLCRLELGDFDAAEDAFQDTVLSLHRRGKSIRDKQAVLAWLMSTARHICSDMRKQRGRRRRAECRAAKSVYVQDSSGEPTRVEERLLVAKAIGQLPDRYGVPLHLGLQGLTPEQIAQSLALPIATVKTRITRGRRKLLARLQSEGVGAAAAGFVLSQRTEAIAMPIALVAAAIKAAMTDVPPALGLVASVWWLKPALAVMLVGGVAAGGIGWSMKSEPSKPPETAGAVETLAERDLRILRDVTTPKVIEVLKPLLLGGGQITVTGHEVQGTKLLLQLVAEHKVGLRHRLNFFYQTLNGGLEVRLDDTGAGTFKRLEHGRPLIFNLPVIGDVGFGADMYIKVRSAFADIGVRYPPLAPTGVDTAFLRQVLPFLGVWSTIGERKYIQLLYVDDSGEHMFLITRDGDIWEAPLIKLDDGRLAVRVGAGDDLVLEDGRLGKIGAPKEHWWVRQP